MSGIDWSKAPEWANAWAEVEHYTIWVCDSCYAYTTSPEKKYEWALNPENIAFRHRSEITSLVSRPGAWDGQGLPPVGTVCEVEPHNTYWGLVTLDAVEMKVAAYHEDLVWLIDKEWRSYWTRTDKADFRPLRAPEQIAAVEREKAVSEMQEDARTADLSRFFERLYDAGWRKQVAP